MLRITYLAVFTMLAASIGFIALSRGASAEELIHFDCVAPPDPLGQNDSQCVARRASVLGIGTVHPDLEISSPNGNRVVKIKAGVSGNSGDEATFGGPNDASILNNCLENPAGTRVDTFGGIPGFWGFGDIDSCSGGACSFRPAGSPVELDFNFIGTTVNKFSLRMFDFGDFNEGLAENHQVLLIAKNAGGTEVDRFDLTFMNDGSLNPVAWACVPSTNCTQVINDLQLAGDTCVAVDGEPGYVTLEVTAPGIASVELRVPEGYDPNVGFDSIRFTKEEGGQGCTPGFWKNHLESWSDTAYSPGDDFDTTFSVDLFDPDITLGEGANAKGGRVNKLARHGVAALLNASDPDVDYPLTVAEVISAVQSGDADTLVGFNELSEECSAL